MFTKPRLPARPRLAGGPPTTQPNAAGFPSIPGKPSTQIASGVAVSDLHRKAQADLERMLRRLGRAPEAAPSEPSISHRARPARAESPNTATRQEPIFTPPRRAEDAAINQPAHGQPRETADTGAPHIALIVMERKLREHKAVLGILAVLIGLALALAVIGQTVTSTGVDKVVTTIGIHARKIAILEAQQTELAITTTRRLDSMNMTLAEVRYPPSEFAEAQNLFRAERYAEAEATYHSFLLRNPSSRLADKALYNAAVSAAMRNNCSSAGSYIKRLQEQFPTSPLRGISKDLTSICHKLRVNQDIPK